MGMGPLLLFLLYNGWTAPNTHEGEGEAKGQRQPRALCKGISATAPASRIFGNSIIQAYKVNNNQILHGD